MKVSGIDHYNLRASRDVLESLRDFYCSIVGLSVGPRPAFRSFGYWLYAGSKDVLHLTESQTRGRHRIGQPLTTFDHVAFACSDPVEYEHRLRTNSIAYESDTPPGTNQFQLFFQDPAGNGVELNFNRSGA